MLPLIWEVDARRQFIGILDYIGARNSVAAQRIDRLIVDGLERIRRFPQSGCPGRVTGTRELIAHPNYIVVYRVTDDAIDVLQVLHAHQRYP